MEASLLEPLFQAARIVVEWVCACMGIGVLAYIGAIGTMSLK